MKVLVTGSEGRIGRILIDKLVASARYEVVGLARSPRADLLRTIELDLRRLDHVAEVVAAEAPDIVVHLAALSGPRSEADPSMLRLMNVDLVGALARSSGAAGAHRFVFASSSAVYGDRYSTPISEDGPLDPVGPYAASKVAAEDLLRDLAPSSGTVAALRIFNVYGAGFHDSLVNRLQQSSRSHPVKLRGWDTFVRDYVDAFEVVDGIVAAMQQPLPAPYSAINVGTGQPTSNGHLVELIGRHQSVHYDVVDGQPSYSCADISLARRVLRVGPRPLDQTL